MSHLSITDEIERAYAQGSNGSSGVLGANLAAGVDVPLIWLHVDDWAALAWNITMFALRPDGSAAGVIDRTLIPWSFIRCNLTWGNARAHETATVDYPQNGGTFQLTGALIRVSVQVPTVFAFGAQALPYILGGMCTPATRDSSIQPSTFTTLPQTVDNSVVGGAGVVNFPIPPRAYAYRILVQSSTVVGLGAGVPPVIVTERAMGAAPSAQLALDRVYDGNIIESQWFPLYPGASAIRLSNQGVVALQSTIYNIIFLLNLS